MSERSVKSPKAAAWIVVVVALLLTLGSTYLVATRLGIHTDPADLLSKDLPFRQTRIRYKELFPLNDQPLILVVESTTPEDADAAVDALEAKLDADPAFHIAYQPRGGPYLRKHALLFMKPEELQRLADALSSSQALMARLAESPDSTTLFDTLSDAIDNDASVEQLETLIATINEAIAAELAGQPGQVSWQRMLSDEMDPGTQRVLVVYPDLDFGQVNSGRRAIERVRQIAATLGFNNGDEKRTMLVTGKTALSYEEVQTVLGGMIVAAPLSLLLVALVLYYALRSLRLMLATMVTLLVGLALTTAWATVAVGHLNLISIAFGVLYLGLGVDFAIHYLLRYRSSLQRGARRSAALGLTRRYTGGALALCSVTTALGFFAFVPTSFTGVSELGIVGGGGMLISLLVTLTLLPSIIQLLPEHHHVPKPRPMPALMATLLDLPMRHRRGVLITAALLAIASAVLVPRIRFNPDPLDLRDPHSESVTTLRKLWDASIAAHWTATVLAEDAEDAKRVAAELAALPDVDKTITVYDFVPRRQDEKLGVIADLNLLMGPSLLSTPAAESTADDATRLAAWRGAIERLIGMQQQKSTPDASATALTNLGHTLTTLQTRIESLSTTDQVALMNGLDERLLGTFPATLRWLVDALSVEAITIENLPAEIRDRWVSVSGAYRVDVLPTESLDDSGQRRRFVEDVQSISPAATGAPVLHVATGEAVVEAFTSALIYAVLGITLMVAIQLRHVVQTLAVLLPLLLGGAVTASIMVVFGMPFNFANVIALPLLLGIGVDNGVHMVHRARDDLPSGRNLLQTVTARAILFSTLTTLCSFGNLSLSPHPGTASMGTLLTIGVFVILACTLILLPALLTPPKQDTD